MRQRRSRAGREVRMDVIERQARDFERRAKRRRLIELAVGGAVALMFATYSTWFDSPAMRWSAASVLGTVIAALMVVLLLVRVQPVDLGTGGDTERRAALRAVLLHHSRVYTWAPLWAILPVLGSASAFVIFLDKVVYAAASPSAMLPANVGVVIGLGFAATALTLEWGRQLGVAADALK